LLDRPSARSGELVVDLAGTAASPWTVPSDSDPAVLRPLVVSAGGPALHAVYRGARAGTTILEVDRLSLWTSLGPVGVCPAQAFRISVTVISA
jgi:hypothetical protein